MPHVVHIMCSTSCNSGARTPKMHLSGGFCGAHCAAVQYGAVCCGVARVLIGWDVDWMCIGYRGRVVCNAVLACLPTVPKKETWHTVWNALWGAMKRGGADRGSQT